MAAILLGLTELGKMTITRAINCRWVSARRKKDGIYQIDLRRVTSRPPTDQGTVRTGAQGAYRRRGRCLARETTRRSAISRAIYSMRSLTRTGGARSISHRGMPDGAPDQ